jgi:hypothetical protein
MMIFSNNTAQMGKGQRFARKHICSKLLLFVGLGAMVLMVMGLLPGCGSDSTPGGSVKGKNAKQDVSAESVKLAAPMEVLIDQKGTVAGKVKKQPDVKRIEVVPQMSMEELGAKIAANAAMHDPKRMEPYPGGGITHEEMKAKIAANAAMHDPKRMDPYPGGGITHEEMKAKIAANAAMHDPKLMYPRAKTTKGN